MDVTISTRLLETLMIGAFREGIMIEDSEWSTALLGSAGSAEEKIDEFWNNSNARLIFKAATNE